METQDKIQQFAELVQEQERKAIIALCGSLNGNEKSYLTSIVHRRKYILVDVGSSGRYVIEGENVFGCKAYGVIHRGYFFGTLDDILARGTVARHITLKSGRQIA